MRPLILLLVMFACVCGSGDVYCGCSSSSCNRCSHVDLSHLSRWASSARRMHRKIGANKNGTVSRLCSEPVLLPPNNNWSVACIWSSDGEIRCSAAPPGVFGFVRLQEWKERLAVFRASLGCPVAYNSTVPENMAEVYYCRERCNTLGIGLIPLCLMFLSLLGIFCHFSSICTPPRPRR